MKRRALHLASLVLLLGLPMVLLWPCLIGDRTYVPWDIAQFAPAATTMDAAEMAATTKNNNTIVTEVPTMFVPELRFLKSELDRGVFPHWNPYSRSGTGAWSSSILGVWYPINWMMLFGGDPEKDLALGAFFSIAIACLLMYGFLIHLGLSIPAALFGASAFALSGTLTVNLHFYQRINALIWLPGLLWAIHALSLRKGIQRVPAFLGLTVCMFMTHTAGFPPFAIGVTLIAIAFTVYVLGAALPKRGFKPISGLALTIAAGALLGVLLGMVQTVPALEFFPESNRTMQPTGNSLASGGFDPAGWLGYFCPTVFNHPHINHVGGLRDKFSPLFWLLYSRSSWSDQAGFSAGTIFNPNLNFCEYTVFVGTLTIFLAVVGLFGRKTPLRLFVVASYGFLMLIAVAPPLSEALLSRPPFSLVPPTRFTGPTCMFIAFLAAAGIHNIQQVPNLLRRGLWVLGYGLSATFGALAWWVSARTPEALLQAFTPTLQEKYAARFAHLTPEDFPAEIAKYMGPDMEMASSQMVYNFTAAAIACAVCASLFLLLPKMLSWKRGHALVLVLAFSMTGYELLDFGIPLNTGRVLMHRPLNDTPVHEFLRDQRDKYAASGGFSVMRAHDPRGDEKPVTLPSQLPPDTLLNEHIRDQQAYTFVDRRSHLPFLKLYGPEQLARSTWPMSVRDSELLRLPYWDMLGIRFMLSEDKLKFAGKPVGPVLSGPANAEVKTRHFYIYERVSALPRGWVVHDFKSVGEGEDPDAHDEAIVDVLIDKSFRPTDVAILDPATVTALGATPHRSKTAGNTRQARFPIAHQTNDLTIEVAAGEAGYLILNDTFMSGWSVTVNKQAAVIHRANLFQRMVVLPAEAATVELRYVTPGFYLGATLSGLSLLLVLVLIGWYFRGRLRGRKKIAAPV